MNGYEVLIKDGALLKVWFCCKLFSLFFFVVHQLNIYMFSNVFHSLTKDRIVQSLKKSVSNSFLALALRLVFMSMYDFNQGLSSNLIPL